MFRHESGPALSLILCSRNDSYMGNSRWRLETTLNYVAENLQRLGLADRVEVLVADWGSDPALSDVVALRPAAADLVSFIHVGPDIARGLQHDSPFPEVLALNAAARRARGDYIGRIDQDTLVGTRFLSTFFDIVDGRLDIGVAAADTLFFSRRRRIPYRIASRSLPLPAIERVIRWCGRSLRVESAPGWAPFYVSSVGIWLVHRDIWHSSGGYDQGMIYMGGMEGNMIARLMSRHPMVDLGAVVNHDFYHLEHYCPWDARHCYTFRRGNDDAYRMEAGVRVFNPNGADWGLAAHDLPAARAGKTPSATAPFSPAAFAIQFLSVGALVVAENGAVWLASLPSRAAAMFRVWQHRFHVASQTVAGQPFSAWPRAVKHRWSTRAVSPLIFPKNIHSVDPRRLREQ